MCLPKKLVYHWGGWTLNREFGYPGAPPKLLKRFKLDMMLLNYSFGNVICKVLVAILGELIDTLANAAKYSLEGHPKESLRAFGGLLGILLLVFDLPYVVRNRWFVQTRIRKLTDEALLARAFIRPDPIPKPIRLLLTLKFLSSARKLLRARAIFVSVGGQGHKEPM